MSLLKEKKMYKKSFICALLGITIIGNKTIWVSYKRYEYFK